MPFVARPSIQEFSVPGLLDQPSAQYFEWVDEQVPAVSVQREGDLVKMHVVGMAQPAIELCVMPSVDGAERFGVTGGIFVGEPAGGTFIFEQPAPGRLRISLIDFTPRLPRIIYLLTHSVVHEYVMRSFRRHMEVARLEGAS